MNTPARAIFNAVFEGFDGFLLKIAQKLIQMGLFA
jgi:hypothetical protein